MPSTHRAYTWRKLKELGALYLQNSICLLPALNEVEKKLTVLRAETAERGGQAQLFHIEWLEPSEEQHLLDRIRNQSGDEYREFLEKCEKFHLELRKERERDHLTFGELDENEAELQKLRSWLPRIITRDYFEVPERGQSIAALEECEKDFTLFEHQIERASDRPLLS